MINTSEVFTFTDVSIADSNTEIAASWNVAEDLPYFDGHFPGRPIIPAVGILDGSIELVNRVQPHLQLTSSRSCKFTAPVVPGMLVGITGKNTKDAEWHVVWVDKRNGDQVIADLHLNFR